MSRKDKLLGPLHIIVRSETYENNWGVLMWLYEKSPTIDLWLGRRMITFRRNTWV